MSDSGNGPLMRPFGELTRNFDAIRVPVREADRKHGPYPYYGASGIVDHVDGFLFDGEYLLIAEDGENLRTRQTPIAFLARGKFWVNNHAHIVQGNEENDTRYLMYAMRVADVTAYLTGSAMPKLTQGNLNRIPVLASPLPKQRAIAAVLGSLDDKIEQNQRTARALERLARAIFRAWFVDFEPVKARAAGAASFPSMPQDVFDALPTTFTDSELGPVPDGWNVVDVYGLATVIYGAPFRSALFNEKGEGQRLIRIRDLQTHLPTVFTPESHPKGYLVQPGDIVVGMDGEFRLHYWTGPDSWLNQRLCSFKPLPGIPVQFLGESLRAPLDYVERSEVATTVIHLGKYDIDRFRLMRPDDDTLRAFGEITTPMLAAYVHAAAESRQLATLRDYLLPQLLNGQVPVEVADA